jgi:hypothetical protein
MDEQQAIRRVGSSSEDPRLAAFVGTVRGLLVPGETIQVVAVQRRAFALFHRRGVVVATSGRLLVFQRGLISGYQMRSVRWQDVSSAGIRVGIFGADLSVGVLDGADLATTERNARSVIVTGLAKIEAQEVYRICQAHDQAWREKRRVRELEEMRARSGGLQFGAGTGTPGMLPGAGRSGSLTERLEIAKDMLLRGLITDAEYEAIKARVISAI